MKIDGSCHCGDITYEAEIDPEGVYVCHCTDCQAISGGTYRWGVNMPAEDLHILSGEPKAYIKTTASGHKNHQIFCANCGSPIYSKTLKDGPPRVNLRLGTARQRAELRPKIELWRCSAQEWANIAGPTEQYDRQ